MQTGAVQWKRFSVWLFVRSLVGFVAAAATGGLVAFVVDALFSIASGGSPGLIITAVIFGIGYGFTFGAPLLLVGGWPIHLALLAVRRVGPLAYMLAGAFAVLAYFLISRDYTSGALGAVNGAAGAFVFWLIRRPDRDGKR